MSEHGLSYTPPGSLRDFMLSDSFITLALGPVGCVSADTEYLTPIGWRRIDSYDGGYVAQWNPATGQAEYVQPTYVKKPCDSFLKFEHGYGLSQVLSDDHRMVYRLRRKGGKLHERTAAQVAEWHDRNGADMIRIPVTYAAPARPGLPLTDDEIRLAVAIQADGHLPDRPNRVSMNLKKVHKIERLLTLLDATGTTYVEHGAADGYRRFYVHTHLLDKSFEPHWWNATPRQLAIIAEEAPLWDGGTTAKGCTMYRSTDKASADFVQHAFVTSGLKTSMNLGGAAHDCWLVMASGKDRDHVGIAGQSKDTHSRNVQRVASEDGFKYCFSVPSSYLILRHNNCVFVTGNSTKTTAAIMKIAFEASRMAKCKDGIRRSRAVWVRNTREELRDTSIPDFLKWFPDGLACRFLKTEYKATLKYDDIECEVLFRGLDDANDVRRLLSLQATFGILDEFRQINPKIFEALQGRLGRYPSQVDNGVGCKREDPTSPTGFANAKKMWGASNPPDLDTYWERLLSDPPDNCKAIFQPSAFSPEADWRQFLDDDYYENLAKGKSEDWIDVYIHSKFGKSLSGRPVFSSFKQDFHVAKEALIPVRSELRPLIIGMDFGLNPSVVVTQTDSQSRLLVLAAMSSDNMGTSRFIREKLKPLLSESRFAGFRIVVVGDPAGSHRAQTDERSCFDILKAEGFTVMPARTNNIVARVAAVDSFLSRQIDGGPAVLFDPAALPIIIACRSGYRYKVLKSGEIENTPDKNPHSHIADAFQYACLHADAGLAGGLLDMQRQTREIKRVSSLGWT